MNERHTYKARGVTKPLYACIARVMLLLLFGLPVDKGDSRAQILPSLGGDRAGTSGFQFLKIPIDPRGAALGEAVVATASDASAMFWNPAMSAQTDGLQVGIHHASYFVDVNMDFVAISYHLRGPALTIGASLQTLTSGEMDVTTEFEPFGTGETFQFIDVALGLTIAQRLTDLFSYGVTGKYVRESVAGISTSTVVFDVGIFYRVGTTGAQMAVSIRNFGLDGTPSGELSRTVIDDPSVRTEKDFESITPPTTFLLGMSYNVLRQDAAQDLFVSAQLNNPNDNAETWNLGVEYVWNHTLMLRTGYRFGVEEYRTPSLGVGIRFPVSAAQLRFDYAFSRLERLGAIHRVGFNIGL